MTNGINKIPIFKETEMSMEHDNFYGEDEEEVHSPTDSSEDSVEVKVSPISGRNKRKCAEPRRVKDPIFTGPLKKRMCLQARVESEQKQKEDDDKKQKFRLDTQFRQDREREEFRQDKELFRPDKEQFRLDKELFRQDKDLIRQDKEQFRLDRDQIRQDREQYRQSREQFIQDKEKQQPFRPWSKDQTKKKDELSTTTTIIDNYDKLNSVPINFNVPYHVPNVFPTSSYTPTPSHGFFRPPSPPIKLTRDTVSPQPVSLVIKRDNNNKSLSEQLLRVPKHPQPNLSNVERDNIIKRTNESFPKLQQKQQQVQQQQQELLQRQQKELLHREQKELLHREQKEFLQREQELLQRDQQCQQQQRLQESSTSSTTSTSPTSKPSGITSNASKKEQRNYKNMTRERRIEANARERTRVHTISAAFDTLRRAIPAYSHSQKLSKLSVLRIACSYIMTLSDMVQDNSQSVQEGVEAVSRTIQREGKLRKKKDDE